MSLSAASESLDGISQAFSDRAAQACAELRLPPKTITVERDRFMKLVQLRAEEGSFVWRIDVPHFIDVEHSHHRVVPLGRVVLSRLAESVLRLRRIDDPFRLLSDREMRQLAQLVLTAAGGSIEWHFRWVERQGLPEPPHVERVEFPDRRLRIWAGRREEQESLFRQFEERSLVAPRLLATPVEAELQGPVVSVGRDHFYVRAEYDNRTLRVRVPMESWEVRIAARALTESRDVVVSGELIPKTRTGHLSRIGRIRIVGEE